MKHVHVKLNSGLPWQKQYSTTTTRGLFSPANWTFKEETSELLHLKRDFVWC